MAALPAPRSKTVEAIYAWWQNKPDRYSRRLGASQIGRECERELWFSFRWCNTGVKFDGRMLRLFNRGHREEAVFVSELRGIGCEVHDLDPTTGQQFTFVGCGGHFVAKVDGVVRGLPESATTWHDVSFKTANAKSFAAIQKGGIAGKPEHFAQVQIEMRLGALTRALYLVACKDNDELYGERVKYDLTAATMLEEKANRVIYAPEPLPGISQDPAFYKCKFCSFAAICHTPKLMPANCRNCLHATPESDGDGRWSCAKWGADIPTDAQADGCEKHRYIPALLKRWGEATDASEAEGWVEYTAPDGLVFRNGPWGLTSFTSKELSNWTPSLLRDAEFAHLREKYAARYLSAAEWEEAA
jgi:hypothetical protein